MQYNLGKGINVPWTAASRPNRRPSVLSSEQARRVWRPRPRAPHSSPGGREAGAQRSACASLQVLPLVPGCCRGKSLLLAASFRLSGESVNSTFLISESLEKRHSTAAGCTPGPRAPAPRAGRETPRTAGESIGVSKRVGRSEEREGQRAETQLEERVEDGPVSRTVGQPGAGRGSVSAPPGLPAAPAKRRPEAWRLGAPLPPHPQPPTRRVPRRPGSDFLAALAGPSGKRPSRGLAIRPVPSRRPRVARSQVG